MYNHEREEIIDKQAKRVLALVKLSIMEEENLTSNGYDAWIDGYCKGFVEAMKAKNNQEDD